MFNIFQTRVALAEGDPLGVEAEGLAIPANDHLWMGAGLPGTIKKEGGEEIEAEAIQQGPASLGSAIATGSGTLGCRRIFHLVVTGQDLKTQTEAIRPAVRAALSAAAGEGFTRLAIAPLEDEENLAAFRAAADQVIAALLEGLSEPSSLQEILLLTGSEGARESYRQALHHAMQGS